ncbi:TKL protein kinase [Pelomyxa schiedti]|nr:TKL protein kinase [Pelomyxa schiedti]
MRGEGRTLWPLRVLVSLSVVFCSLFAARSVQAAKGDETFAQAFDAAVVRLRSDGELSAVKLGVNAVLLDCIPTPKGKYSYDSDFSSTSMQTRVARESVPFEENDSHSHSIHSYSEDDGPNENLYQDATDAYLFPSRESLSNYIKVFPDAPRDRQYVDTENLLEEILRTQKVYIPAGVGSNTTEALREIIYKINDYYDTSIDIIRVPSNSTELHLLTDEEVDATDSRLLIAGMEKGRKRSVVWRPSCNVYGERLFLVCRQNGEFGATNFSKYINELVMLSKPVQGCCTSYVHGQLLKLLFPGISVVLQKTREQCLNYTLYNDTLTLSYGTPEEVATYSLFGLETDNYFPTASFFRREILEENKINDSYTPQTHETGNDQLGDLYDAALMNFVKTGYYNLLFEYWDMSHYLYLDCIPQGAYNIWTYSECEGTVKHILDTGKVKIGTLMWEAMPLIQQHEAGLAEGLLATLEKQIFTWIGEQFGIETIELEYVPFHTSDETFSALESGVIDVTSMFFFSGAFYRKDNDTLRRNVVFRPSCSTVGEPINFVVKKNSGFKSLDDLRAHIAGDDHCRVAVQNEELGWIVQWLLRGLNYSLITISSTVDIFVAINSSEHWAAGVPTTPFEGHIAEFQQLTYFDSNTIIPTTAFFRRDKQFPCGNGELEKQYGEQCEIGTYGCNASTCKCQTNFVADTFGCKDQSKKLPTLTIALCTIIGGLLLLISVLLLVVLFKMNRNNHWRKLTDTGYVQFDEVPACGGLRRYANTSRDTGVPCIFSKAKIDFGTSESLLQVEAEGKDSVSVTNVEDEPITVKVVCPSNDKVEHKYSLRVFPLSTTIPPDSSVDINLVLMPKCTSDIAFELVFEISGLKFNLVLPVSATVQLSTRLDSDEIMIGEKIGQGASGCVFKATWRGLEVAVKTFPPYVYSNEAYRSNLEREIDLCVLLRSPNIVAFYGSSISPTLCFIVMEYIPLGNLQDNLKKHLDWDLKVTFAREIAQGIFFLHSNKVIHRDLKPENVLVVSLVKEAPHHVKLSDFGSARHASSVDNQQYTGCVGTPLYTAPETLSGSRYAQKADVYSFGILMWTILTQELPFQDIESIYAVIQYVGGGGRPHIPPSSPPWYGELMSHCWAHNPDDRPESAEAVTVLTQNSS